MHTPISLMSSVSLKTKEDSLRKEIKGDLDKDYEVNGPTTVAIISC